MVCVQIPKDLGTVCGHGCLVMFFVFTALWFAHVAALSGTDNQKKVNYLLFHIDCRGQVINATHI